MRKKPLPLTEYDDVSRLYLQQYVGYLSLILQKFCMLGIFTSFL